MSEKCLRFKDCKMSIILSLCRFHINSVLGTKPKIVSDICATLKINLE